MYQTLLLFFVCICCTFAPNLVWGQELLPTVVIEGEGQSSSSGLDPFSVFKAEQVSQEKLNSSTRQTLADVVQDQTGVDTQTYCANCGAKRLTINGLKGEHTSILTDGLPLHSAVSSFYGVDSVPVNGIENILVMRGAGASLTNPEAIGGTLNIQTVDPLNGNSGYLTSIGADDRMTGKSQNHQILYTLPTKTRHWGLSFGGQFARMETWDEDNNGVAESPQRENFSGMAKARFLLGKKNDFTARFSHSQLEILGGPSNPSKPTTVFPVAAREQDFRNGSVEDQFLGNPLQITDWVSLQRQELAFTGTHYLTDDITWDWKVGGARQEQSSIYQHGFDYANIDNLVVGDSQVRIALTESQYLTAGLFFKDQRLRSDSGVLFGPGSTLQLPSDAFDFSSYATYLQYSYVLGESLEIDMALRADKIRVNWLNLDNEVKDTVVAPRFQALHNITEHLTQRLSYGLGYRAPLTFFESQHGNQESGYRIDITDLENAHSAVYSLSYNTPSFYITGSVHYTQLQNMAFGFEAPGTEILYRNDSAKYDIWVSDLLLGWKPKDWWLLETSLEFFQYEDGYKRNLPTAAIERRLQMRSFIDYGPWKHTLRGTLVGSRDLSKFGAYNNHFVNRDQGAEPQLQENLQRKNQNSPLWMTFDTSISYAFSAPLALTLSVNNIFNYTQTGAGDSPSTWHWHFVHAHYDALHTWGPNQGRQYMLSLSGEL